MKKTIFDLAEILIEKLEKSPKEGVRAYELLEKIIPEVSKNTQYTKMAALRKEAQLFRLTFFEVDGELFVQKALGEIMRAPKSVGSKI